jgi:TonB-linked SusC/RagA family outer membrane protein
MKKNYSLLFQCMKISLIQLLFSCLFVSLSLANKAEAQEILNRELSIQVNDIKIKNALSIIEKSTKVRFSYSPQVIQSDRRVSLVAKNTTLGEILDRILTPNQIGYNVVGNQIILIAQKSIQKATNISDEDNLQKSLGLSVKGIVIDAENNNPLPGVTILVKGTNKGANTNNNGEYAIEVPDEKSVLIFSFIGYAPQEVIVGNRTQINVGLRTDTKSLDEVVVVGYGEQNARDVTTSVGQIKASAMKDMAALGLDKALTGKLAGVQVLETSGAPGSGINIRVRGTNSISAGNEPLYVVDGIPLSNDVENGVGGRRVNPLNMINTADIETVEILKDASSAAIYGSRGASGVVLITTKKGKSGKPSFSYDAYYGIQKVTKKIEMMDAYQWSKLAYDARTNTYLDFLKANKKVGSASDNNDQRIANGLKANGDLPIPATFPYLTDTPNLTNTDWQDQIFRTAPLQSHTLSVSGGTDNVRYFASGNYLNQDGVVIGSGFQKFGGKFNLDVTRGKLRAGIDVIPTVSTYDNITTEGRWTDENVVSTALQALPIYPAYNTDGSLNFDNAIIGYNSAQAINPIALATMKKDKVQQTQLLTNFYAEYAITSDLKFKLSVGSTINNFDRNFFRPSTLPFAGVLVATPRGEKNTRNITNWLIENTLNYKKTFGKHNFTALIGYSAQKEKDELTILAGTFPNDLIQTFNGTVTPTLYQTSINEWSLISYLSRIQYGFNNKYLLTGTLRADGSSRFGQDNKFGYFPSVSAGWIVSEEEFLKNSKAISSLKLRASYGVSGNFKIGNYEPVARLNSDNYVFGVNEGTQLVGFKPTNAQNDKLGWEKTQQIDIGLDASFFQNKLNFMVDYYNSNTSDLLLNLPVPEISGFSFLRQNIGKVNNKGLEITVSTNHKIGGLKMTNSINYSTNKNMVTDLGGLSQLPLINLAGGLAYITKVGEPIGSYYTLVKEGVYSQAQINDSSVPKASNSNAGDFRFKDVNGDGKIDTNDKDIVGNYAPDFTYGFSSNLEYKNLDFNVSVQGVQGNEVVNLNKRYYASTESFGGASTFGLNRWISDAQPGDGQTPRANRNSTGLTSSTSTYHVEDASYLRIRSITLGYKIPTGFTQKLNISNARIYISTINPFTFTKYSAYNPETSNLNDPQSPGLDYGTYPLAKSYTIGLHINF